MLPSIDDILLEGKKYYPDLKYRLSVTKKDRVPKLRMCYGSQKHTPNVFIGCLRDKKFDIFVAKISLEDKSIATSGSVYGVYKHQTVRIATHVCNRDYTISIIIRWNTDLEQEILKFN